MLLPKGKNHEIMSFYHPLCMTDEVGYFLEQIIHGLFKLHLYDNQYIPELIDVVNSTVHVWS